MVPPTQACEISTTMATYSALTSKNSNKCTKKNECKSTCGMSRNAARERYRVKSLRNAFHTLQKCLPSVPPNTKLSKLDVLILATTYISHLSRILNEDEMLQESAMISTIDFDAHEDSIPQMVESETRNPNWEKSYLHPVRKWPMRSRLYAGVEENKSATEIITTSVIQTSTWD